jgi:hypothetical protein
MSNFIDKLNRLSRGEHQPIGFGAKQSAAPRSKIQLVASLTQEGVDGSSADSITGIDAGLLRISRPEAITESLQKMIETLPDIPCGVWLQGSIRGGIKQLTGAGCDFIVFPAADTPLTIVEKGEVGRILEVEPSLNEGLLRTVNELPVDAVLIAGEEKKEGPLTWQQLMRFQRFADLLTKPLLVSAPAKLAGSELLALWEAGVSGVVVEADTGQAQDRLKKLRQEIDKLDFPSQRRREKPEAILPRTGREMGTNVTEIEEGE